jgi:ABC-type tungstate transport system permease subunit
MNIRSALAVLVILGPINSASAVDQTITLASTTSVDATGLLANILPQFTAETGIAVKLIAEPPARALDAARRGDADIVLVHDPAAEREFIHEGYGTTRWQIAWNDKAWQAVAYRSKNPCRLAGIVRRPASHRRLSGQWRKAVSMRRPLRPNKPV